MKQTVEERLKEEFVNGATKWELTDYQIKRLWSWFERNIQQQIQANDDAWRSKVLELKAILEKNKDEPVTGNVVLLELNNIFIDLKENK